MTSRGYVILTLAALIFLAVGLLMLLSMPHSWVRFFIRLSALWGYTAMALAIMFIPFLKEIRKIFGRSFLKLHHWFAFLGLIFITVHPLAASHEAGSFSVFLPVFDSWLGFWVYAGRPALILIYIAFVVVLFRKKIKPWRIIHSLMMIALLFGFVHGIYIGTDFASLPILIIFSVLLGLAAAAFIAKRIQLYRNYKKSHN